MKKLLVLLLALVVFLALAVGCEYLPDEVLENLGISNDQTNDDVDNGDGSDAEHTHSYSATVTEPTCTKQGYTTYSCECGDNYKDDYVSATGHSYTDTVVDPDCTNVGYTHRVCACGYTYNTDQTEPLGHTLTATVIDPTDVDEGYTVYECYCGYETKDNFVQPTAASFGLVYEISEDGTYSILVSCGTCTDSTVTVQRTYCGLPVEEIGIYAFGITEGYIRVVLPDTVKVIKNNAFTECFDLISINIPEGVTSIEDSAFQSCESLVSIYIPSSVTSIGNEAFAGWTNKLISIQVDEANPAYKSVDGSLYTKDGATLLRYAIARADVSFEVPEGVETLGAGAFACAANLKEIILPEGLKRMESNAIVFCASLESLDLPASVEYIDAYAFNACYSVSEITVDTDNDFYRSVDGNLYTKDGGVLVAYAIGKSSAYFNVPDFVTEIGENAFSYATLERVTLSGSVVRINDRAFSGCDSLSYIIIPDGVTYIGDGAFFANESLEVVSFLGTEVEWSNITVGLSNEDLLGAEIIFGEDGN